jgi:glycosyltransferase involved in cell wall biosynthesis
MFQDRISVIFDGIDTDVVRPDTQAHVRLQSAGKVLKAGDEVITFVNRNLEPYRGYHIMMRALPEIQRLRPNAMVVIVGGNEVSYGARAPAGKTWKQIFLDEVRDRIDIERVRFVGKLPYPAYLKLIQLSACHVYLTYPFVLSWSCLEAMSVGGLVVASDTQPVREVIEHGRNGLLVDFHDVSALARTVAQALENRESMAPLRAQARKDTIDRYDLRTVCLPRQLELVKRVAG